VLKYAILISVLFSVVDPDLDPHNFGKLDPDPHQSSKMHPHQSEQPDPDPHQSNKVKVLHVEGHFEALEGPNMGKSE
jgi:hypothetical protein